ncbi:phosphoglycerate mutase [Streptomyces sp. TUS-ST3]|uniref:histidine phosphatase family protein n=2 Tax=Streptomyces TaxID=1883 RepID=UPI00235B4FD7|nr:histidine phosphatase family protein [Streptomyces sp. TUS-ST3]GLP70217.1 phosphoglycerate mutase [Streptomyces sp. TUS-ST3]
MTSRVTFISPATNPSLRQARFDDSRTPLDDAGRAQARAAAGTLRPADRVVSSPGVRCRETAAALGLADAEEVAELAGLGVGRWRGRTLDEVSAAEPDAVAQWLADPASAPPHDGESVQALCLRIGRWLDSMGEVDGRTVAVVEPDVVRAVVVRVLGAPVAAFWRADVAPLTATEISGRSGRWNLRMGHPLGPHAIGS